MEQHAAEIQDITVKKYVATLYCMRIYNWPCTLRSWCPV